MLNLGLKFETRIIGGHKVRFYLDKCPNCNIPVTRKVDKLFKDCAACRNRKIVADNFIFDVETSNKRKVQVRRKTQRAIKTGRLIKKPCEICGNIKSQAHHDNYSEWWSVKWLCSKHHMSQHLKNKTKIKYTDAHPLVRVGVTSLDLC